MPAVCSRASRLATCRTAPASVSDPRPAAGGTSSTIASTASQAIAATPARARKPARQDQFSTTHASGVAVISMPTPPKPRTRPDRRENWSAGQRRVMKTIVASSAGAQPTPISNWPTTRNVKPGAAAETTPPSTAKGNAPTTVRRGPCRSRATPMTSCAAANARWYAPAKTPSACAERPNSPWTWPAMTAATVRKAWLSAKTTVSAASMIPSGTAAFARAMACRKARHPSRARRARMSACISHPAPPSRQRSPIQRNESAVISVKLQRVRSPASLLPSCTMSAPRARPTWRE